MDELKKRTAAGTAWILTLVRHSISLYAICVITRCAETAEASPNPACPAEGVMVSAGVLPVGFRTESIESLTVVFTRAISTI